MAEFWGFDQVDVDGLVFTSYNSLDWKRVSPIALELRKLGVPVWYDYGLQAGGKDWDIQISRHIRISNVLVIFVTKGIFDRKDSWVMWEFTRAFELGKPFVPVYLDDEVLSTEFYREWAKNFPESFDHYATFLDRWKRTEGVVRKAGMTDAETAMAIKQKLDRSPYISYPVIPWVDKQAEMKKKAEEAKAKAEREARAEKARKEAEEKARAEREAQAEKERQEAEKKARAEREAQAEKARKEAEEKARAEREAQAEKERQEAEKKARAEREARAEKERQEAEEKARAQVMPIVKVGSRVQFGHYPQSSYDPEPIMWRVLDVIDGKALMISEDLLDAPHRFDAKSNNWQSSELRAWLNKDFLNKAFSADEKTKIGTILIKKKSLFGKPEEDKVTCLSREEAEKYFSGDDDRKAKPTAYARKNGAYVNSDYGTGWWWLRSPGSSSGRATYVDSSGIIGFLIGVDDDDCCVRPVVFASL